MRYLCVLALASVSMLCSCQSPRTREVTVVIDGVTYKGTVTEQLPVREQVHAALHSLVTPRPATAPRPGLQLGADKLLMTDKWALNQPATQFPDETRSLTSGDAPKPIAENFTTIFGPNRIHFDTTMPINVVDTSKTPNLFVKVNITTDWGSDDASHVPALGSRIEGIDDPNGDHHILVYDRATGILHELFGVTRDAGGQYSAQAYRRWDTNTPQVGKLGQNSADAAGLPIVPLLLRYNEATSGSIHHALRFTMHHTRANGNGGVFSLPASHAAGTNWSVPSYMGMRLRLRGDFDASNLSQIDQVIVRCMKTYGIVIADNGVSGMLTADDDLRWDQEDLRHLGNGMHLSDFIPVNSGPIIDSSGAEAK